MFSVVNVSAYVDIGGGGDEKLKTPCRLVLICVVRVQNKTSEYQLMFNRILFMV